MEIKNKEFKKVADDAVEDKVAESKTFKYKVEVDINDTTLKGKGDDMSKAFVKLSPEWFKSRAIVRVTEGAKTVEYDLMTMHRTRKFFGNDIFRGMMVKLLKEKLEIC